MAIFLIEAYAARGRAEDQRGRARLAGELGRGVRYVRTTFVPGDETVLHLFEAGSDEALRAAALAADLQYERIVEAVEGSAESFSPSLEAES